MKLQTCEDKRSTSQVSAINYATYKFYCTWKYSMNMYQQPEHLGWTTIVQLSTVVKYSYHAAFRRPLHTIVCGKLHCANYIAK